MSERVCAGGECGRRRDRKLQDSQAFECKIELKADFDQLNKQAKHGVSFLVARVRSLLAEQGLLTVLDWRLQHQLLTVQALLSKGGRDEGLRAQGLGAIEMLGSQL